MRAVFGNPISRHFDQPQSTRHGLETVVPHHRRAKRRSEVVSGIVSGSLSGTPLSYLTQGKNNLQAGGPYRLSSTMAFSLSAKALLFTSIASAILKKTKKGVEFNCACADLFSIRGITGCSCTKKWPTRQPFCLRL